MDNSLLILLNFNEVLSKNKNLNLVDYKVRILTPKMVRMH